MAKRLTNKRPPRTLASIIRKPSAVGFIKVYSDEPLERFNEVGKMVKQGVLKWIAFKTEGPLSYHYYKRVVKKVTKKK